MFALIKFVALATFFQSHRGIVQEIVGKGNKLQAFIDKMQDFRRLWHFTDKAPNLNEKQ